MSFVSLLCGVQVEAGAEGGGDRQEQAGVAVGGEGEVGLAQVRVRLPSVVVHFPRGSWVSP